MNPKVRITMENGHTIDIELYPEYAPITVQNFLDLTNQKFYDGLIFHRVILGFVIQGGDPKGNGMGGSKKHIDGEFEKNKRPNPIKHERGVISMARSESFNSASSQFFICHKDAPHLDGLYAAFGKVISGMETVDEIAQTPTDWDDRPLKEQKMKSIRVIE